jgi:hypothetical protein
VKRAPHALARAKYRVLSPGARNVRRDRVVKPALYASRGVGPLWMVDPRAQTLEEPFDAVELGIGAWWLPGGEGEP